ncbi:hypothetical protein H4O18_15290 [Arenibacter sp. BSSL-BM3]|uniref:Uncharacterized protein n=1 Tax=Arenibacter arenosicollis TaxID=2762274 RepID=A0ABR7QQ96_9FLAO|nr:hypothetical protein [Arenibacter arenosicollis]MBC8769360.1 hypothetical protein [Arenibacter arenosicollis]
MALEDAFNDLRNNLYRPLLFFIPKSLVPESKKEFLDSPEFARFFNTPAIIEKSGESFELKSNPNHVQILEKPSILVGNNFLLSDQKAALNSFQFSVLLEKYLEQLKFYNTIASWMALHIKEHCEIEENILEYFELQDTFFQHHLGEINAIFNVNVIPNTDPKDALEYIEKDLPAFKKLFQTKESNHPEQNLDNLPKQKNKRKPRPVLVTEEEARNFLLKSVFNVTA